MQLNDYTVPDHQLTLSVVTTFDSEDLSGETSSTSSAHKGIKPKEVSVSFLVRYRDVALLSAFYQVAEAVNGNGDLVVYTITEATTNAVNIRQVTFTGRLETRDVPDVDAWRVSCRLKETLSVPEKTEQRLETTDSSVPPTEGQTIATVEDTEALTSFERVLQFVDASLA